VDALHTDKLGRLALTHQGLAERDRAVFQLVRELSVPCVVTLGGGYSDPIAATVEAHANTFRRAADLLGPQ
jgi:acetoin utilization deacetylase AcuC-like enzyme